MCVCVCVCDFYLKPTDVATPSVLLPLLFLLLLLLLRFFFVSTLEAMQNWCSFDDAVKDCAGVFHTASCVRACVCARVCVCGCACM